MAFLKQHQASHSHYYDLVSRGEGELAQFQVSYKNEATWFVFLKLEYGAGADSRRGYCKLLQIVLGTPTFRVEGR